MRRPHIGFILATIFSSLATLTAGHSQFTAVALAPLPDTTYSFAESINSHGQMAGFGYLTDGTAHALAWVRGSVVDLGGLPGASGGDAHAINDRGQAVGVVGRPGGFYEPVVWEHGLITPLGLPFGMTSGEARDINERGDIVGTATEDPWVGGQQALLWRNGMVSDLGERFTRISNGYSAAWAINNRGEITGQMGAGHAFLWTRGSVIDLGALPGGSTSIGVDINERGQVVGWSDTGKGDSRAFLWEKGRMIDLGGGAAWAINNRGEVVGQSDVGHAFLWIHGTMIALEELPGSSFSRAAGINDRGDIVGVCGTTRGNEAVVWLRKPA